MGLTAIRARRRAVVAGCIGNLFEWYDFALYGAFAAVMAATFFPTDDALSGLVGAFGVFGVAFLARPLGAVVFGHFGDRAGRRRALAVGITAMAVATAGMGMLPSHASVGALAPVLLIVLRAAQGVAIGGEYGGSATLVVEFAPANRRGLFGGWQWATVGFGLAVGLGAAALLSAVLPGSAVQAWGWRLPFLAALPLGAIGLYVRSRLDETPSFQALQRVGVSRNPLVGAVTMHRRRIVIGFALVAAVTVTFNIFYIFLPALLTGRGLVDGGRAFAAAFVGLTLGSAVAPLFGRLSDTVGRRPVLILGLAGLLLLVGPAYRLIVRGDMAGMLAGYAVVGLALGCLALTTFLAELFPTSVRYSGLSLTYGLASAVFGGSAPLLATLLVQRTGHMASPLWYAAATIVMGLLAVVVAPETVAQDLDVEVASATSPTGPETGLASGPG